MKGMQGLLGDSDEFDERTRSARLQNLAHTRKVTDSTEVRWAHIVLNFAIENSLVVNELCRGRKRPLLIDLKNLKSITPQARSYFSARDRDQISTLLPLSYIRTFSAWWATSLFSLTGRVYRRGCSMTKKVQWNG